MSRRALANMTLVGLGAVALVSVANKQAPSKPAEQTRPSAADPLAAIEAKRKGALYEINLKWDWRKGGFGSVAVGNFTVTNNNAFPVKDVEFKCTFYGNSGTELNRHSLTLYETFGAKKSKTIRDVSVGFINQQVSQSACSPTRLVVPEAL